VIYLTNNQRNRLQLVGPSVQNFTDIIAAMIRTGNSDMWIKGISDAIGSIVEVKVLNEGSGYTGGPYNNVELRDTGSAVGLFATADFAVIDGKLTMEVVQNGGQAYKKGDQLTVDSADVGGGTGWLCEVVLVEPIK
jgi:hypothetical protein